MKRLAIVFVTGVLTGATLMYVFVPKAPDDPLTSAVSNAGQRESSVPGRSPRTGSAINAVAEIPGDIEALAENDPMAALERISRIPDLGQRQNALFTVLESFDGFDPAAVIDRALDIRDQNVRAQVIGSLLVQWIARDTTAALSYVAGMDRRDLLMNQNAFYQLYQGLQVSQNSDPIALLSLAERLPPQIAGGITAGIMQRFALDDPAAAAEYVSGLSAFERQQFAPAVASAYAATDPDAALAWARASSPTALPMVVAKIAETEPLRALDIAMGMQDGNAMMMVIVSAMNAQSVERSDMAATLLALPPSPIRTQAINAMTQQWVQSEPEVALEWLVSQTDLSPDLFGTAADMLYQRPDLAATYIDRVPPAARERWLSAMARGYVAFDPLGAVDWVDQFRNYPGYAEAVGGVAVGIAQYDGAAAAELIDRNALASDPTIVSQVVQMWASADPTAAARWAESLAEPNVRRSAMSDLGRTWMGFDPAAAEQWMFGMPASADRDAILAAVVASSGLVYAYGDGRDRLDRLIGAFSSDALREETVAGIAPHLVAQDEARARALMNRYVTDPALWEQFEARVSPTSR